MSNEQTCLCLPDVADAVCKCYDTGYSALPCARLGFVYQRYQDRLPPWARVQHRKSVAGQASILQPHKKRQPKELNGGAHEDLSEDIRARTYKQTPRQAEKSGAAVLPL